MCCFLPLAGLAEEKDGFVLTATVAAEESALLSLPVEGSAQLLSLAKGDALTITALGTTYREALAGDAAGYVATADIAFDVMASLSAYGCRGVFSTHLHELVTMKEEINRLPRSRSAVDTLVAGTDRRGKRTYKIYRKTPDGKSYAAGIAGRYGLCYEELLRLQDEKQGGIKHG